MVCKDNHAFACGKGFELCYTPDRFGVCGIATDAPYGISRHTQESALPEYLQYFLDVVSEQKH